MAIWFTEPKELTDKELVYFLINQSTHTASAVYSRVLLLVSRYPFVHSSKEIHKDEIRKKVDQEKVDQGC